MNAKRRSLSSAIDVIKRTTAPDRQLEALLELLDMPGSPESEARLWILLWFYALERSDLEVLARAQVQVLERRRHLRPKATVVLPHAVMTGMVRLARTSAIGTSSLEALYDASLELCGATVKNSAQRARIAYSTGGSVVDTVLQLTDDDLDEGLSVGTCAACSAHQLIQQAFDQQDAERIISLSASISSGRWTACEDMAPPIGPIALYLVPAARHLDRSIDHVILPRPDIPTHIDPAEAEAGRLLLRASRDRSGALADLQRAEAPASPVMDDIAWMWWFAAASWVCAGNVEGEVTLPFVGKMSVARASEVAREEAWDRARRLDRRNGNSRWTERLTLWERWMA